MSDLFNDPVILEPEPKKRRSKKIIISTLVALVLVGVLVVAGYAKIMDHFHGGPLGMMIEKMTKDLNLTSDQKTQVDQLKAEIKAKMDAKRDANKDARKQSAEDFANLFKQNTLDKQAVQDLAAKREKDREDMKSFMVDELVKFHDILTPDQRDKVAEKIKDFGNKMHDKDGNDKIKNN